MMGKVWLACCACDRYPELQREIEMRDPRAKILRVGDAESLLRVVEAFSRSGERAPVMIGREADADEGLLDLVERLCQSGAAAQIVVVAAQADAALAARLFNAGANEVIAGRGEFPPDREREAGAETGHMAAIRDEDKGRDDVASGAPHDTGRLTRVVEGAIHSGAPEEHLSHANYADDLDEPDAFASAGDDAAVSTPARGGAPTPLSRSVGVRSRSARSAQGGAPLITLISGRGGCGKTTVAAALALRSAEVGLRCALLDLDLMFGNLYAILGIEEPSDAFVLERSARLGALGEEDIVRASMRVAPGLTLWGPVRAPEHAELMAPAVEQLIEVMRGEADLIVADTSLYWSDSVAAAVASCDRCLVVGDAGVGSISSAERAIDFAGRLGVSRTKMASVFNRLSSHGGEDAATRFEFTTALGCKGRIADGGEELIGLASIGHFSDAFTHAGPFRSSACAFTDQLLRELGFSITSQEVPATDTSGRPRIRLPWHRGGDVR